jgi:hypothetical protein
VQGAALRMGLGAAIPYDSGAVAQLGAHLNGIERVRGSNPLSSTWSIVAYGLWSDTAQ